MNKLAPALCLLALLASCAKKKTELGTQAARTSSSLAPVPAYAQPPMWVGYSARGKLKYDDGSQQFSATATIRVAQGQWLWLSISPGLGIEAARVLIRPDSLFVLNRLESSLLKGSLVDLQAYVGSPLSFADLQAMVVGYQPYDTTQFQKTKQDGALKYRAVAPDSTRYTIVADSAGHTLGWQVLTQQHSLMDLSWSEYRAQGLPPYVRDLLLKWRSQQGEQRLKLWLSMSRQQYTTQAEEMSFAVPDGYQVQVLQP